MNGTGGDASVGPGENLLSLLCVEDSTDDVELIARELIRNGLAPTVQQAQTREEMESALKARRWDVICMDYQLPRFDALRALELRSELAADTPVIVVSGYIGETAAVSLLKAGADDYIPKNNLARLAPALRRAMRDVEERRARRQAEEDRARLITQLESALAMRDDFLVLASHELRTPLTALRLHLEGVARLKGVDEVVRRRITRADLQIDRISRLVEDMLTVSKLRPPEPVRLEPTDLPGLVSRVTKAFTAGQEIDNLTVHAPPEPMIARLDPRQTEDALRRLLENAVKYGGGEPIDVRAERIGPAILTSVTDRGIGIAPEHHARIFERFGRAGSTLNYGGLGLGLWIARGLVESQGGTVNVASRLGEGATFTISIPASQ